MTRIGLESRRTWSSLCRTAVMHGAIDSYVHIPASWWKRPLLDAMGVFSRFEVPASPYVFVGSPYSSSFSIIKQLCGMQGLAQHRRELTSTKLTNEADGIR